MFKILNNLRKLTLMFSVVAMLVVAPSVTIALDEVKNGLSVSSTTAGFDTYYSFVGGNDFDLFLIDPDGDKTLLKSKSERIDGKYLKEAGTYNLIAASKVKSGLFGSKYKIEAQARFDVMASDTDANKSRLEFLVKPALGKEVPVVVTLKDKYGNPVVGNEVALLADNSSKVNYVSSKLSNEEGKVLFKYVKLEDGKDKVLARDKTDDVLLSTTEISKFAAASVYGFGGDVALAEGDRFEFTDAPSAVEPYESFDFTLRALDTDQDLDEGYTGTVRFFSATDESAGLPEDYNFDEIDAGEAMFIEEAYFTEEGTHTLDVVDIDNEELIGSIEIEVVESGGEDIITEGDLLVSAPTGGTSNTSVINFKGITEPGLEVKVFDNGEILTAEDADAEGNFDFNSPVLTDGEHTFVLTAGESSSEEIVVTIDTSADLVSNIQIDPTQVSGGDAVSFEVDLTIDASRVSVIIDEKRDDLVQADTVGRSFTGVVNAPGTAGEYSVDLIIVDTDGESTTLSDVASIEVGSGGSGEITFNVPSQVLGVQAVPGDKRVNLNWQAAFDNTGIASYRVNYGIDPNLLISSITTNDSSTTWYVPNLSNGTTYYFQVFGIDTEGNLSDQGSAIVSATPSNVYGGGLHGSADGQVTVNQVTESGPEVYILLVFAGIFAYWFRLDKKFV